MVNKRMAIKITLTDIFQYEAKRTESLPESTDSAALSREQMQALIQRFAEEDARVFNFLQFYKSSPFDKEPTLSYQRARSSFKYYLEKPHPNYDMELSKKVWLSVKDSEMTGMMKMSKLAAKIELAFKCRGVLEQMQNPAAEVKLIVAMKELSRQIERCSARHWGISPKEAQLIKNIMLPGNPFDPELADKDTLADMYSTHLQQKTVIRPDNQRTADNNKDTITIRV